MIASPLRDLVLNELGTEELEDARVGLQQDRAAVKVLEETPGRRFIVSIVGKCDDQSKFLFMFCVCVPTEKETKM